MTGGPERTSFEPDLRTRTDPIYTLAAGDGSELPYRRFEPAGERRASLVYQHGIQSHGGWYGETAAALAARGYAMYLPDRRGSGVSGAPRGYFRSSSDLVDDVRRFVELARKEGGEAPIVVVGGCWGARPAIGYALESQEELAGLVLVCPALRAKVDLTLGEKLKVVTAGVVRPRLPVRIPLEPELFTRNQPYLDFIRTDPLALHEVTASFFLKQALWDRRLLKQAGLRLPLLVLQSGRDEIVDADGVRAWFDEQASTDKRFVVYPEFDHLLDFEEERQRYWDDLAGWLDELTTRPAAEAQEPTPA